MKYDRMGQNRTYRLSVPQLSGGINAHDDASLIADDELVDASNLYWANGGLRTRTALQAVGTQPITAIPVGQDGTNNGWVVHKNEHILAHPFEVDGQLCTVIAGGAKYASGSDISTALEHHIQVVTLDGEVLYDYGLQDTMARAMTVVPCDPDTYGCAFLLYRGNVVYKPNNSTMMMERIPDEDLYAPLVMINATGYVYSPADGDPYEETGLPANGVMYEGFNALTRRYRAQFTTDTEGLYETLVLPTKITGRVTVDVMSEYGEASVTMTVGGGEVALDIGDGVERLVRANADGMITFIHALPVSEVSNTVTVTCSAASHTGETTLGATLSTWFGGTQNRLGGTRLFLAGFTSDKKAAKVMWSDVGEPLYFPENNYMYVGDPSQRVTALEKQDDMLVIFKERELYYTTYVQGEIDADAVLSGVNADVTVSQAYFPLTQLSPMIGCDCPHTVALCHNRLVWMCSDARVYALVNSGQYSERNVRPIGTKIVRHIREHSDIAMRKTASAGDYDGRYVLLIGKTAYLFDYTDSGFANLTSYSSSKKAEQNIAWYVWRFDGFPDEAAQRILTDGAHRALIVSTQDIKEDARIRYAYARVLYRFADGEEDMHLTLGTDSDGVAVRQTSVPICSYLLSKSFDFGNEAAFKRIKAMFLTAKASNAVLRFAVNGRQEAAYKRFRSDTMQTRLVMPSVKRCQTLAVMLESEKPLCIKGMQWQYVPFGTVR